MEMNTCGMTDDASDADETLLVPVANEETVERQMDTAIDVAADRGMEILVMHVVDVPPQLSLTDGRELFVDDEDEALLRDAVSMAEAAGVPVESQMRIARSITQGLLGGIEAEEIDTVLMGWRGRPPKEGLVLGGYLDKVLGMAECDVLVKRIKTPQPEIDSVLVPVAGGPHDEFARETAASIARQNDATLRFLHVHAAEQPELSRSEAETLLRAATDDARSVSTVEADLVESDDITGTITDRTSEHDLTVLGVTRGGLLQQRLIGSVSEAVARHAAGSVILAKRYDPMQSRLRRFVSGSR